MRILRSGGSREVDGFFFVALGSDTGQAQVSRGVVGIGRERFFEQVFGFGAVEALEEEQTPLGLDQRRSGVLLVRGAKQTVGVVVVFQAPLASGRKERMGAAGKRSETGPRLGA